jgi:hypothetical protein
VRKSSAWASSIRVFNAEARLVQTYLAVALPFGAFAAVYGFSRFARAIRMIGTRLFSLVWTNYVDDFPQRDLSFRGAQSSADAERLFRLIGWRFSIKPEKRIPLAPTFDKLGVTVDLSMSSRGEICIKNRADRVVQLADIADDIAARGLCTHAEAISLRGKLVFAEGQVFVAQRLAECSSTVRTLRIFPNALAAFTCRCCNTTPCTLLPSWRLCWFSSRALRGRLGCCTAASSTPSTITPRGPH